MATRTRNTQKAQQGKDVGALSEASRYPFYSFAPRGTAPAGNQSRRRKSTLTAAQRLGQRIRYSLSHPIDALWGSLSSVRTAIYLIVAIAVICLLGIYFIQAPGEVLSDPIAYSAWIQQNALPRYGSLTPIYDWLQLFTIFSSWYFKLLLTILSLSIVVCTLNRAPTIWQNFAHPLLRRSDKFYQNALERAEFTREDAVAWTRTALRKRHYRVRSLVETRDVGTQFIVAARPGHDKAHSVDDEVPSDGSPAVDTQEITYLYANKNSWATLSTFVFHAALVTLLMAGVVSQWHGFDPNSPARHYLPAPILALTDNMAGFSFDQALPNDESAVVYPRGTPHNISFRANNFTATFDPTTGLPTDYVTDLSVYRDGELVAHSNHLRVNDPLAYGGVVFHQSSLIPAVSITITDKQGYVIFHESVILDQTDNSQSGIAVDYARGIPIAGTNLTMSVLFPHSPSLELVQVQHPRIIIGVGLPGSNPNQNKVLLRLTPGQSGQSVDKEWTITLDSAKEATVLLVTKDTGASLVWPAAVILILSLCITFYFPQRRIWIRIEGQRVQMAALREHFTNIRTDLLGIVRQSKH